LGALDFVDITKENGGPTTFFFAANFRFKKTSQENCIFQQL
jgi:hypothetical protein